MRLGLASRRADLVVALVGRPIHCTFHPSLWLGISAPRPSGLLAGHSVHCTCFLLVLLVPGHCGLCSGAPTAGFGPLCARLRGCVGWPLRAARFTLCPCGSLVPRLQLSLQVVVAQRFSPSTSPKPTLQGDLTSPLSAFTLEVCATFTRQQGLDWRSLAHLRQQAPTVQESSGTAFSTPSAPPIVMASTQPASSDVDPPVGGVAARDKRRICPVLSVIAIDVGTISLRCHT